MEAEVSQAPPVVAVVVVHEPGNWFNETVAALAAQDYPNLRLLFLLADTTDAVLIDTERRIRAVIPDAFIRAVDDNPGFGAVANEVLQLVEGDNGFFLLCHDDVAPERDAVRILVEELYRSNAGIVGPKLVEWDRPRVLQHVGLQLDRFGDVDPVAEPEEYDQGQHDGVADAFAVPTACMLIRADLFRSLGGFDPKVSFHGDDVDLCWRAHLSGARVVVAPQATVRHVEAITTRRQDVNHRALKARHRMRSVATLTGGRRLVAQSLMLVGLTLLELVVGLFTGRFGEAWASLRAVVGLVPRTPVLLARRRAVRPQRHVDDAEIEALLTRRSARLASYLRHRDAVVYIGVDSTVRRWRENSAASAFAWVTVIVAVLIGSRSFITSSVPSVGEFLPFPDSPRELWDGFVSSWNPSGFGSSSPNPTGWALIAVASVGALFNMGLAHTLAVVVLILLGIFGAGKVGTVFPSTRARIACFVVYGSAPLLGGIVARGDWTALVVYAAVPWFIHLLRLGAGLATADPRAADVDLVDGVIDMALRERIRYIAFAVLLAGVGAAFAPVVVPMLVVVGLVVAVGTLLGGGAVRTAGWIAAMALGTGVGGFVLNLPWSTTWSWEAMTPRSLSGAERFGFVDIVGLGMGSQTFGALALGLYLPLLVALGVARAWRLTWAVRAACLVMGFGAVAVLADRGSIGLALPPATVLLVPVALGLAVGAAATLAAFDLDVRGGDFGWRQPVGVLAAAAVVVGVIPGVLALRDGSWQASETATTRLLELRLAADEDDGGGRVLFVGDPRALPVEGQELRDGVAYAVVEQGPLDVRQRWRAAETDGDDLVRDAFRLMADGDTIRAGRMLGALGIRYVVVPRVERALPGEEPLTVPAGLLDAIDDQLDLQAQTSPPSFQIYRNYAHLPLAALLEGSVAAASETPDVSELLLAQLDGISPLFGAALVAGATVDDVSEGAVHLGVPFDDRWSLSVDGDTVEAREGFGVTTAFDVADDSRATLRYDSDGSRTMLLILTAALWVLVMAAASRLDLPGGRSRPLGEEETLLDLADEGVVVADAGPETGLPPETESHEPELAEEPDIGDDAPPGPDLPGEPGGRP